MHVCVFVGTFNELFARYSLPGFDCLSNLRSTVTGAVSVYLLPIWENSNGRMMVFARIMISC